MAKAIVVAKFTPLEKVFKEVVNAVEKIGNDDQTRQAASLAVAQNVAKEIQQKYIAYASTVSGFEGGKNNVTVKIEPVSSSKYNVRVYGTNVLYQEYGTGSRGLEKPHPNHNRDGMNPYGSGENVIRGTIQGLEEKYSLKTKKTKISWSYFNKNNGKRTPYWYPLYLDKPGRFPNDFGNSQISEKDYVWRHRGTITKGLPAGKFVYEGCEKYRKDIRSKKSLQRTMVLEIGKRMKQLRKPVFTGDMKKYMIELKVYNQLKAQRNGGK